MWKRQTQPKQTHSRGQNYNCRPSKREDGAGKNRHHRGASRGGITIASQLRQRRTNKLRRARRGDRGCMRAHSAPHAVVVDELVTSPAEQLNQSRRSEGQCHAHLVLVQTHPIKEGLNGKQEGTVWLVRNQRPGMCAGTVTV
eukprot:273342-Chlamydomonas_euryale.AAC.3